MCRVNGIEFNEIQKDLRELRENYTWAFEIPKRYMQTLAEMHNLEYVGHGCRRAAFRVPNTNFVFKVAYEIQYGNDENLRQFAAYRMVKNTPFAENFQATDMLCDCNTVLLCHWVEGSILTDLKDVTAYKFAVMHTEYITAKVAQFGLILRDFTDQNVILTSDNKVIIIDMF